MCQPLMAEGEFALVQQHLGVALGESARWVGDHDLYAMLVDAAAEARDATALATYLPRAEETAARYNHQLYRGMVHRARGVSHVLTGEFVQAEIELNEALNIFERLETRFQLGRALAEKGELARAQGDAASTRSHIARAIEIFQDIGAMPEVQKLLERLN
jgi:tetratricopeptide (TPR) repeat protein